MTSNTPKQEQLCQCPGALDAYQAHYLGTFQVSGLVFHVFSDMSLYKQGDQNG